MALPATLLNIADTTTGSPAFRRRVWPLLLSALLLTAGVAEILTHPHLFGLLDQLRHPVQSVSLLQLVFGVLSIYAGLVIRAARWALLMPREMRPRARTLVAPQFAGFAAVSLFGRVADLTRPYLVARRTRTPVTVQIGIYTVERALDIAATATLFSVTLLFVPQSMPHHAAFSRAGILAAAATAFLLAIALILRARGDLLASYARRLQPRSPRLATALATRILELQSGFSTIRSVSQLAGAFAWSVLIWFGIAMSYLFVAHSLPATPRLAQLGLPAILLLMATSMGASLLQLPVIGWFTQVAAMAAAYHGFFGVPMTAASLCGFLTFAVNTLSVIPAGLLLAYTSGLSLREARTAVRKEQIPA